MLLALALVASLAAADPVPQQQVAVVLVDEARTAGLSVSAETTWLGEARRLSLRDDGLPPDERPEDGVYTGQWTGEPPRQLALRLYVEAPGQARALVAASNELLALGEDRLVWVLDGSRARRTAAALPGRTMDIVDAAGVAASVGWMLFVFAVLAFQILAHRREGRR
jgi:hypothetical protein